MNSGAPENYEQEVFGLETAVKKLYEAMFLVDSTQASDWDAVDKIVKNILKRADAEIVSIRNWAERKLAYEIGHKSRGTYALCYFRAQSDKIRNIEKDVQLSEQVMRVLILSAETREEEALQAASGAALTGQAAAVSARTSEGDTASAEIQPHLRRAGVDSPAKVADITEEPLEETDTLQDSDSTDESERGI